MNFGEALERWNDLEPQAKQDIISILTDQFHFKHIANYRGVGSSALERARDLLNAATELGNK